MTIILCSHSYSVFFFASLFRLVSKAKSMVRVFVKWGKERLEVDANVHDSPLQLKSQLFSLTGVNPERQKVLIKVSRILYIRWFFFRHLVNFL